jgi:6,7-dimethyl-8-ribityllumazine synthase
MKPDHSDDAVPEPDLTGAGHGLRIAVVCARFNSHITLRLLDGVDRGLAPTGATAEHRWVPGAFEIPLVAQTMTTTGRFDAVIGIGCVIRGETAHFEHVAGQSAAGLQHVALSTGIPTIFGVLTTDTNDQALARSQPAGGHNVGEDSARTAVEMARLLDDIRHATPRSAAPSAAGDS